MSLLQRATKLKITIFDQNGDEVSVSLKLLGLISCENLWLLIARHSVLREREAKDQVIRSLAN
jgi:hypothetical protein